ncbi:MAG: hypothetical protein K6G16_05030 [Lachnospiraceae bacterium]|nr:hypothetical protein [Lachnospiraceae bacterium]
MIFRRTGDALEKSNGLNRAMTVVIILLIAAIVINILAAFAEFKRRRNRSSDRIEPVEKIEQQIQWSGMSRALDVSYYGAYGIAGSDAHKRLWAQAEAFGEHFLEDAWHRVGDEEQAAAAEQRAAGWEARQ